MTENTTLSRRAAVAGATAMAVAVPSIGTALAAPSCPAKDAELIALVGEWFKVGQQLEQAEAQLDELEMAARPDWPEPDGGTDVHGRTIFWADREELVAYWDKRLESMAGHPQLALHQQWREKALQEFDAWYATLEENRQANGAAASMPKVEALRAHHAAILERIFALPAQTAAGALAKLRIFAAEDRWKDSRAPWAAELLQLALADLERQAANMGRAA